MQRRFSTPTVISAMVIAAVAGSGYSAIAGAASSSTKAAATTKSVTAKLTTGSGQGAKGACDGDHHGGGPGGRGHGGPPPFAAAVNKYLGVTEAQVQSNFQAGKTLADLAKTQGKTAQGVEDIIIADAQTHLAADVKAGTITQAQADQRLADMKTHVVDMVEKARPAHQDGPGGRGGMGGPGGMTPPPAAPTSSTTTTTGAAPSA